MRYMRKTAGYIWSDYKTNTEITNELKITPVILVKLFNLLLISFIYICIYVYIYHYQCVLPKGRFLPLQTQSSRLQFLPKGIFSTANSGTKVAVLLGMNRCGSFPLLSAPHSLLSNCIDLKRSEKMPGTPTRR